MATGVIGAVAMILMILFLGRIGVSLFAALLALGLVHEYSQIVFQLPDRSEKKIVLLGTTWLIAFTSFWLPRVEYDLLLISFLGLFTYFLFTADRYKGPDRASDFSLHFKELVFAVFGLIYLGFLPLFFPLLRESIHGAQWLILFLLIVWGADTGAYFVGKKWGKRKLYPVISPKKTIEGAIGGIGSSILVTLLFKLLVFQKLPFGAVLVVPVLVGVVSQVGDLCESFFKRSFNVKDSGSILPGHGGLIDRFDGVLFALPIMYGCVKIFG